MADIVLASAVFVAALCVYVWTLAPGLLRNDSAEFQTLAHTVGHTHPTGYPVYILSAHAVTRLPIRSIAYRVNLVSALTGAVAVTGVVVLGLMLTGRRWLPAAAAAQLALSPTFWSQAIVAEVYIPAAAVTLGVLLLLLAWSRTRDPWLLFAAGTLGGLGLAIHPTVALMAPAAIAFVVTGGAALRSSLAAAAGGAITGVALTLLAFVAVDRNAPPSDYFRAVVEPSRSEWGLSADGLDDFGDRLRFSVLGIQYQDKVNRWSVDHLRRQALNFVGNLPNELPWPWLAAAGVGTLHLSLRNPRFALLVLGSLVMHAAYLAQKVKADVNVAYIPLYLHVALLAMCCLGVRQWGAPRDIARGRWRWLTTVVTAALLLSTVLPMLRAEAWTPEGRRAVWQPEGEPFEVDISERLHRSLRPIVDALEPGAVVFCDWDELYAFYYVAHVVQGRTDLSFVQIRPATQQARVASSALDFIESSLTSRAIYLLHSDSDLAERFDVFPVTRGGRAMFSVRHRGQ
jgi:hypothetical protein